MLAPAALAQRPPNPKVEIYIPTGMPIQIEATRDESELTITKYNIKRIVGPEVRKVTVVTFLVRQDGNVGRETRYTTTRGPDPASIAWASSVDVARLILIVERLETDTGVWVMGDEGEDRHATLAATVERGAEALPRARFVKKE